MVSFAKTLKDVQECNICADNLPLGPRPVVQVNPAAKILIIGQAPGTKVHETGIPWNDPSGDRLRDWMQVERDVFYDAAKIAIVPMGFCYPGRLEKGGDKPPRPECALAWHDLLLAALPNIKLTLLVGMYAQNYYLKSTKKKTLTETVRQWPEFGPDFIPTPHPSWRTTGWLKKNAWFEAELVPNLRQRVKALL
ncbi:MAG: uracil-DNA glycosylase family protein [Rhodospirillaceae bacterium]|jgi:uracil-DNA glycosylase|nr:uracil-DNA glycosylase family protein [Rhodospirillaceae bacterium]MBT4588419.1 uracil-DNA glycosylase family protein [Rhodospirillaceae bacterium]MBT4938101.1 uracil-DNA glycosylase family protein [Rhodospirillaceae bacterium]MBT5938828.1 uracil-DNA glycosylase family protein [Rhodospirillaceae bacterium]MBT7267576.1 uracil-DNA glycosylase family protein [Rhodospirillaceae bacterium]